MERNGGVVKKKKVTGASLGYARPLLLPTSWSPHHVEIWMLLHLGACERAWKSVAAMVGVSPGWRQG